MTGSISGQKHSSIGLLDSEKPGTRVLKSSTRACRNDCFSAQSLTKRFCEKRPPGKVNTGMRGNRLTQGYAGLSAVLVLAVANYAHEIISRFGFYGSLHKHYPFYMAESLDKWFCQPDLAHFDALIWPTPSC